MSKIIGSELKNIPWEEKPEGYSLPVWRYSGNPIIGRHATKRPTACSTAPWYPLGTALPVSSAVTAVQSAWTFLGL